MPLIAGDLYSFNRYYVARPESDSIALPNCQTVVIQAVLASHGKTAGEKAVMFL